MNRLDASSLPFYRFACIFEASLALVAIAFGWLTDIDPFTHLSFSDTAVANGVILTLPALAWFLLLRQAPVAELRKIQLLLRDTLGKPLASRNWADLLILAGIAGFAEEALFRGGLQPWLEHHTSSLVALIASNIVFALVHAVTPMYALLAFCMGCYLGWSLDFGDERNLLQPMVLHGLYDFVAFLVIVREFRQIGDAHAD